MIDKSIKPIRIASRLNNATEDMIREAIMGEMNWGEYGHDAATNAAGGAAMGAVAGAGAFSLPGALIGAASGALGGVAEHGAKDWWYASRSNEDKASWQAGDIEDRIGKVADIVSKANPKMGEMLKILAKEYKQYIDGAVQKKQGVDISSNMFNQNSKMQATACTSRKFIRFAQQPPVAGAAVPGAAVPAANGAASLAAPLVGGATNAAAQSTSEKLLQSLHSKYLLSRAATDGTQAMENGVVGTVENAVANPNFWSKAKNFAKGGIASGIASTGVDLALGGLENLTKGDQGILTESIADIQKGIVAVNGLTLNDPAVVSSGDMAWTLLHRLSVQNQAALSQPQNQAQNQQT